MEGTQLATSPTSGWSSCDTGCMAMGGDAWYPRSFLLTDIVGSVSVWERDAGRMSQAVARHDELVRSAVQAADGELVRSKGEGDSTFSVFTHPAGAPGRGRPDPARNCG
jgi:hypothetical protein